MRIKYKKAWLEEQIAKEVPLWLGYRGLLQSGKGLLNGEECEVIDEDGNPYPPKEPADER